MRIFHDGRTGSIRIIARDEADQARSLADDEAGDAADAPQPHTRGGRPVVVLATTPISQTTRGNDDSAPTRASLDVPGRD